MEGNRFLIYLAAPVMVTKLPGVKSYLFALLLSLVCATGEASNLDQHADELASLIDPAKK